MSLFAADFHSRRVSNLLLAPGSWTHTGAVLDVIPRKLAPGGKFWLNSHTREWATEADAPSHAALDLREFRGQPNTAEFQLRKIRIISKNVFYNCCPEPYPVIEMEFELQVRLFLPPPSSPTFSPVPPALLPSLSVLFPLLTTRACAGALAREFKRAECVHLQACI